MIRLHLIVEGASEEASINSVLGPHLATMDVFCDATMVTTNRRLGRAGKGGGGSYGRWRFDITTRILQDQKTDAYFTTMFDRYHLPSDFPGLNCPDVTVESLETALQHDIDSLRFIPYLQLHEFEALILADPDKLKHLYPNQGAAIDELFPLSSNPEAVDLDDPPSKRILRLVPGYNKTLAAAQIAERIGLDCMRRTCPHFAAWLSRLESLALQ